MAYRVAESRRGGIGNMEQQKMENRELESPSLEPEYKEIYNNCQFQRCSCKFCIHDETGLCTFQDGDCAQAAELDRCPVVICPNYEGR